MPSDGRPSAHRVSVLLSHHLGVLTYAAARPIAPGTIVAAPLGGRQVPGVVWDDPPDATIEPGRLRAVEPADPEVAIADELRRFVDFAARYTLTPRGAILRTVLRSGEALAREKPAKALALTGADPERWTPARLKVRAALRAGPMPRTALAEAAGVSQSVLAGLIASGVIAEVDAPQVCAPAPDPCPSTLTDAQAEAADTLREFVEARSFTPILLEGVTGSGKTEVYLEAIAATLAAGRQALVLMPEIALTPMVVDRLTRRFGVAPGEWHSSRSPKARNSLWRSVGTGATKVVVGARSALFLPFADLGLIVVDEEHDQSFKQEDGIIFHARDMAIARARAAGVPAVLASATPSIETKINAERGRYRHLTLPARYSGTALPEIITVDLRRTPPARGEWLADPVRDAVATTLASGAQALLFLNRRGYAPLTVCRRCGHRFHCPNCSASLVEHRLRAKLMCHHCGHEATRPRACPSCEAADSLTPCGPGVERVEEEAAALWPEARRLVLSSDLTGGTGALAEGLEKVARGEVDIVVGTQLVAKGFNFPQLQLVVVVDADLGLENGDPRAAERTFQLLTQVTGRAGRVREGGRALLQTHAPDHPVIRAMKAGDGAAFYAEEAAIRREGGLPPYMRLAAIIVSATTREEAHAHAAALAAAAPQTEEVEVLGPAEAPLAVLRSRYRYRLLVRAPRTVPLQTILVEWLGGVAIKGTVRRAVDIDPQSFL